MKRPLKKLTLTLDALRVEAFATGGADTSRGTVQGHYGTTHTLAVTCEETCPGNITCWPEPEYC